MLHRSWFCEALSQGETKSIILWCQCPFSEWSCKMQDQGSAGHTHTALLYAQQMAGDGHGAFVAICHAPLQPCYQLYSTIGHYPFSSQTIFRHICGTKAMTLSCLWLSDIYLGQYTTVWPRHVQKEVEGTSWSVFGALT